MATAVAAVSSAVGVSEFLTYGHYVDHVAGGAPDRHLPAATPLCPNWFEFDMQTEAGRAGFIDAIDETHLGIVVQSNLRLPASVMSDVKAKAARRVEVA